MDWSDSGHKVKKEIRRRDVTSERLSSFNEGFVPTRVIPTENKLRVMSLGMGYRCESHGAIRVLLVGFPE